MLNGLKPIVLNKQKKNRNLFSFLFLIASYLDNMSSSDTWLNSDIRKIVDS